MILPLMYIAVFGLVVVSIFGFGPPPKRKISILEITLWGIFGLVPLTIWAYKAASGPFTPLVAIEVFAASAVVVVAVLVYERAGIREKMTITKRRKESKR